ncbi:hypothetical protein BGZ83_009112 [Gryganskiella cystojenkinii]|nr:hypothetical protein BGZ83_009112 [Gryganskiella cystojenkinii]
MDMLEIRLRELEHVVDQFVIVEAEETFKRNPKPLYYYENRARFKKYAHKITHMVLPRMPDVEMQRIRDERILWYGWEVEVFERNTALLTLFEQLKPEEGDWIIISDLDEIPRSSVIRSLTSTTDAGRYYAVETGGEEQQDPDMVVPKDKDLYRLNCNFHEMSFEYKVQFLDVGGPVLLRYRHENSALYNAETDKVAIEKGLKTAGEVYELNRFMDRSWINAGNELRMARNNANLTALNNSCWHCTFCLPNMANVVRKLESFSHHEYNLDEFKTQDHIVFQASHGRDILNRIEDDLIHVPNNKDLPLELRENGDRYQYMLHRFGKFDTGGFLDVTPVPPNLKE